MKKNVLIGSVVALVIILLGVWAYMASRPAANNTSTTPTNESSNTTPKTPASDTSTSTETAITYSDGGFSPAILSVKKGSTVSVTNNSKTDIKFSSDNHPTHTLDPELNMDTLKPGESGTFTVTKTGTWGYHDHYHSEATGKITVTE